MADSFIPRRDPVSTGHKIDADEVTVGANTVLRERLHIVGGQSSTPIPLSVKSSGSNNNNAAVVTVQPTANSGNPTVVNLTADTPLLVASSNDARKELVIQNPETSTVNITIGTTNGVTVGGGVVLIPGGSATDTSWKGDIYLISASNTSVIVWEKAG